MLKPPPPISGPLYRGLVGALAVLGGGGIAALRNVDTRPAPTGAKHGYQRRTPRVAQRSVDKKRTESQAHGVARKLDRIVSLLPNTPSQRVDDVVRRIRTRRI